MLLNEPPFGPASVLSFNGGKGAGLVCEFRLQAGGQVRTCLEYGLHTGQTVRTAFEVLCVRGVEPATPEDS